MDTVKTFFRDLFRFLFCRYVSQEGFYQNAHATRPEPMTSAPGGLSCEIWFFGRSRTETMNGLSAIVQRRKTEGWKIGSYSPVVKRSSGWFYPVWTKPYWTGRP